VQQDLHIQHQELQLQQHHQQEQQQSLEDPEQELFVDHVQDHQQEQEREPDEEDDVSQLDEDHQVICRVDHLRGFSDDEAPEVDPSQPSHRSSQAVDSESDGSDLAAVEFPAEAPSTADPAALLKKLAAETARLRSALALSRAVGSSFKSGVFDLGRLISSSASDGQPLSARCLENYSTAVSSLSNSNAAAEVAVRSCLTEGNEAMLSVQRCSADMESCSPSAPHTVLAYFSIESLHAAEAAWEAWSAHNKIAKEAVRQASCVLNELNEFIEGLEGTFVTAKLQREALAAAANSPARTDVKWYRERLSNTIFPGSVLTVLDTVFFLLFWRRTYKVGKASMDILLKFISKMLPFGSTFVPTLHLAKQVLGVTDWEKHELHVCCRRDCPGYVWPHLAHNEWHSHGHDACPRCSSPRFKESFATGELNSVYNVG
jgi:hypothetical protein